MQPEGSQVSPSFYTRAQSDFPRIVTGPLQKKGLEGFPSDLDAKAAARSPV